MALYSTNKLLTRWHNKNTRLILLLAIVVFVICTKQSAAQQEAVPQGILSAGSVASSGADFVIKPREITRQGALASMVILEIFDSGSYVIVRGAGNQWAGFGSNKYSKCI